MFLYNKFISSILCCILLSRSACVHGHKRHLHEDIHTFENVVTGLDTNIAALASECTDNDDANPSPHLNIQVASLPFCSTDVDPALGAAMGLGLLALDAATGGVASPIFAIAQVAYTMFCPKVFVPPQSSQLQIAENLARMVVTEEIMKQITSDVQHLAIRASAYADANVKMPRWAMLDLAIDHASEANNAAQLGVVGVHLWANNAGLALNYLENYLAEQRERGDQPCVSYATSLRKIYVDSFIANYNGMKNDFNNYKDVETVVQWFDKNEWVCIHMGTFRTYVEWEAYFFTRQGDGKRECSRSYHEGVKFHCIYTRPKVLEMWTDCKRDFFREISDSNFNTAVVQFYTKMLEVQKRLTPSPAPTPTPKSSFCGPCRRQSDCVSGLNCDNGICDIPHFPGRPGIC